MITDILMNGSMVKNHLSLKTGFGYNATRRTSFLSWFQACQRVLPPVLIIQLQGHLQDRRGIVLHLLQARLLHLQQSEIQTRERGDQTESDISSVPVSSFNVDDRTGAIRCLPTQVAQVLKSRSGCKNSWKIWWMMKFLNAETHMPVRTRIHQI